MKVRMLGAEDASVFQALRLRGLRECSSAFGASYEEECETPLDVVGERLTANAHRAMFGGLDDSTLLGVAGIQREQMHKLKHKALLWGMYVAPVARNRGVARRLVTEALKHAFAMNGVRQVNLGVNAQNEPAIALYEAAGFKRFGLERGCMIVDGTLQDELHMVCVNKQHKEE